jgi:penicillin-binding protein 1C
MRSSLRAVLLTALVAPLLLAGVTWWNMRPVMPDYRALASDMHRVQVLDRHGTPLNVTYQNRWNLYDVRALHEMPEFLQQAFLVAEDRRFQEHGGIDWQARFGALWANLRQGRTVRGASTLSEQVVRMLHPRPRTLWSRWLEGWEAQQLEAQLTKPDILEFYLNQVPYARNWRGVVQAARGYFNRNLDTLNRKEMLALAVLVRAPSALDPWQKKGGDRLNAAITRLADAMQERGLLNAEEHARLAEQAFALEAPTPPLDASHFVQYVRLHGSGAERIRSTLDAGLQAKVRSLLNERLKALAPKQVHNAAAMVADHRTGEVLAWVVAGDASTPSRAIDPVITPRQPGSALKPFLYATALEKGWTAATLIEDAPLQDAVGAGLHAFRNYSRHYYGPVSLREALANSLNTPAVRTVNYVGVADYLKRLHQLGFASLGDDSRRYDVGLALGNGEVTLKELVQGYAALAQGGQFRPLRLTMDAHAVTPTPVISAPAASLIGHILSDPYARQLEFGASSVLNLPVQTAAKTGTSTDYRDAWAVGYNYRYVVGLWMGNLDQTPTDGVTGSTGPSLALRAIFAELTRGQRTRPLPLDRHLLAQEVCLPAAGQSQQGCTARTEYFLPGQMPDAVAYAPPVTPGILRPTQNLQMAYDPRIPSELQAFRWEVGGLPEGGEVEWFLNGQQVARTDKATYLWPVARGKYELTAFFWSPDGDVKKSGPVRFVVK